VPVPLHRDQDLLRVRHAPEHHDGAALVAQQRPGGHQQQRPRLTLTKPTGGISDEGDRASVEGGLDGGTLGWREPLGRRPGARIGMPIGKVDGLLTTLDGQRQGGIAIHHPDLRVAVSRKGQRGSHRLNACLRACGSPDGTAGIAISAS
jgi:hypothetical protein